MRISSVLIAAAAGLVCASAASASYIVDRNVVRPTLQVDKRGYALVQYRRAGGKRRHVFLWGAVNGVANEDLGRPQVRFKTDYTGGWARFGSAKAWKRFHNACRPYDGPVLPLVVAGCKAPDGSYWALQEWDRLLPMRGLAPWNPEQTAVELHVSHWSGALPELQIWPHWTYGGRWQGMFGRLLYDGFPVYGKQSTSFGQYVYIDTYNSVYGPGWRHDAGKALHLRNGGVCFSFVPQYPPADYPTHALRPPGLGERHRVSVIGPGVTPIVRWEGARLGPYDPVADLALDQIFDRILGGDRVCAKER